MLVIEARGDDEAKDHAARALLERAGMVFYAKQATNQWCARFFRGWVRIIATGSQCPQV